MSTATTTTHQFELPLFPDQPETTHTHTSAPPEADLPLAVHIHRALAALEPLALTAADQDILRLARRTLTRHQPLWLNNQDRPSPNCEPCDRPDPCRHVTALAGALGL